MKKILVIEDHAMMRRNVLVILEMEGYRVASASNGREGLALAATEHPDLILCDVMMPELDGHAVLTALRADPQTASIPFIFLTAKGEKADQRAGMNLGADDYLTKPITRNDLVTALDSIRTGGATGHVELEVSGMTCAACPITVKRVLSKVEGVSKTNVNFDKRQAVVTFDDAKTSVQKLTKATEEAGYPSSVKQ